MIAIGSSDNETYPICIVVNAVQCDITLQYAQVLRDQLDDLIRLEWNQEIKTEKAE